MPFEVSSGQIIVSGPEDDVGEHRVTLPSGHYKLVIAQAVLDEERTFVDLYMDQLVTPLVRSRILLADDAMNPPDTLLETAEIA